MILADYLCPDCGVFEASVSAPAPDAIECSCGAPATWSPSPIAGRVKAGETTRGKVDRAPPGALDTRELGEGMPLAEWKAKRRKQRQSETRNAIFKEFGK